MPLVGAGSLTGGRAGGPGQRAAWGRHGEPYRSVVLFRREVGGHDEYEAWSRRLPAAKRAGDTSSGWRGETVGRLVFLHPGTTTDMVDEVIDALD